MTGGGRHGRGVSDDAFYEWLLSDHPGARAERDRRRAATYQAQTGNAAAVRAWAGKVSAQPDAPQPLRDLAAAMSPQADQAAARAQARHAEPDEADVTRLRAQHETHMQVSGPPGSPEYRYPAHLTGPGAAACPPPEPGDPAPEPETGPVLTITLSQVNGNTGTGHGGGILQDGVTMNDMLGLPGGPLTLKLSQVIGNSAGFGGGIFASTGSPVTLKITLIAKNTPDNCEPLGSIPGCKN